MKRTLIAGVLAAAGVFGATVVVRDKETVSRSAIAQTDAGQDSVRNPFDDGSDAVAPSDTASPPVSDAVPREARAETSTPNVDATTGDGYSTPASAGSSCGDGKRTCGEMSDCADARYHLQQCGMSRLDGDGDGVPCENVCGH